MLHCFAADVTVFSNWRRFKALWLGFPLVLAGQPQTQHSADLLLIHRYRSGLTLTTSISPPVDETIFNIDSAPSSRTMGAIDSSSPSSCAFHITYGSGVLVGGIRRALRGPLKWTVETVLGIVLLSMGLLPFCYEAKT